jgi:cleavage stimulation factor subunit 3
MELDNDDFAHAEQIFTKTLLNANNVQLWRVYLDYIRRRHNINIDTTGKARMTVQQAFDFTLSKVGIDKDAGVLWQDYIAFVKSGPGVIGGNGWQDNQKMDAVRAAYKRALSVPSELISSFWSEYQAFEVGLNKVTVSALLSYLHRLC